MVSLAQCLAQVNAIQLQASCPLNWSEHDALVEKLDHVKDNIEAIENADVFAKNLKDQIICLYGKIDDALISYELNTIQNEALLLQGMLKSRNIKALSQTVHSLKHHIASLWDHYRPSLQERRVITFAEEQLEEAMDARSTKTASLSIEEREEVESALEMIGDALIQNDEKRAAFEFNRLSKEQQKLLCAYLPKEERSSFLHEVEGAAHNNKIFLRKR